MQTSSETKHAMKKIFLSAFFGAAVVFLGGEAFAQAATPAAWAPECANLQPWPATQLYVATSGRVCACLPIVDTDGVSLDAAAVLTGNLYVDSAKVASGNSAPGTQLCLTAPRTIKGLNHSIAYTAASADGTEGAAATAPGQFPFGVPGTPLLAPSK